MERVGGGIITGRQHDRYLTNSDVGPVLPIFTYYYFYLLLLGTIRKILRSDESPFILGGNPNKYHWIANTTSLYSYHKDLRPVPGIDFFSWLILLLLIPLTIDITILIRPLTFGGPLPP